MTQARLRPVCLISWVPRNAVGFTERLGRPELNNASRAVDSMLIDVIFRRCYLLIIFVDGSSTCRVYLHTHVGHRYKDETVVVVSGNRVGSLTWRGRSGVDLANNKGGHHRVVVRVENWDVNGLKSAKYTYSSPELNQISSAPTLATVVKTLPVAMSITSPQLVTSR